MSTLKPLKIDIVSDVVCPWCYIGKRRIEDALAAAEPELGGLLADAVGPDLEAVRSLYAHASANHEWVLSYLSAPDDPAVAARALVPEVGTSVTPA